MAKTGRSSLAVISAVLSTSVVLARVGIVVGVAMLLFLFAFLGYFVIPFIFVLLALGILGLSSTLREFTGLQTRRRK
ncbi:MAG: hypothetical protein AB7G21_15155 [Dehalococcoidia bacterium]